VACQGPVAGAWRKKMKEDIVERDLISTLYSISIRLSPTSDPYGHPNPKWVAGDLKSASN